MESITLWFPNPISVAGASGQTQIRHGNFGLPVVARVKPGVAPEAPTAQLDLIASRLPENYGGSPGILLLIACANLANLFLVSSTRREP